MIRRIGTATAVVAAFVPVLAFSNGAAGASGIGNRQSQHSDVGVAGGNYFIRSEHRKTRNGDVCTLGFAVRSSRAHRLGMLTAGHCARNLRGGPPYLVHQTRRAQHSTTYVGDLLGVVGRHATRFGRYGDSGFIQLAAHRRAVPRVFTRGVASRHSVRIVGVVQPRNGMRVCYSGAASGEHCGFKVVRGSRTVGFPFHGRVHRIHREWTATRAHCPASPGDSGAPVYTKHHGRVHAVGILTGGRKLVGRCPFYFSPVRLALHHLHLHLLTAR